LALSQEDAPGTTRQIARETGISQTSVRLIIHRHSAKVPEETILAWSGMQQSITDQAVSQWQNRLNACVKAKGKQTL